MRRPLPQLPLPAFLTLTAFALALRQRPGWATSDTKIDLHVDPSGFLADVASVWTSSGSLGHVQGGQYGGYLFPMGPFFALGHAAGLAPWLVHRLWLGTLLALAAWGTVRLLDALLGEPRGVAHAVAGLLVLVNPYVVVFTARTSLTLLAYAALPWLLLAAHRGLRDPRGWWWPAAFALLVTSTGGGVNAAVTAWVLVGPLLLAAYEPLTGAVPWRAVRDFALRAAATTFVASLWWVVPIVVQAAYGIDFLIFTEQPGTIWGTTSASETLRLMGYWVSYAGVGFHGPSRAYFSDGPALLFDPLVVCAQLLVPALVLGAFAWTRRRPWAPFFLLLTLLGVVIMMAGFPEGAPLRRALTFVYNRAEAVHFLRTTYKAGPLVALGLAVLGGLAAAELYRRVRTRGRRAALAVAGVALLAVAAGPMTRGDALDAQLLWKEIPSAWTRAADDLDSDLPHNTRAVVLPGQLFAYYRWGGTVDPILPALTRRPVADRNIVPYADLHAIDYFWTVDALVDQARLLPGQLPPLLDLLGAGAVIANADDDIRRSGAPPAADAARVLAAQPGLARPTRSYGPGLRAVPGDGEIASPLVLPQVRRHDLPGGRGIVRVEPDAAPTIVDGSAEGIAALAAFGALPRRTPLAYAADRSAADVRRAAAGGGEIVITDSNRRRVFVAARLEQALGATLGAGDPVSEDAPVLNPFPERGTAAQTIAVFSGARSIRAPTSPGVEQFPEHRPFAAFDGDPRTAWLADSALTVDQRWIEIRFRAPRDVPYVYVRPHNDRFGTTRILDVAGRRFAVRSGLNRLPLGLRGADRLRIRIARFRFTKASKAGSAGGIDEVRVPGLRVQESLRPPVLAERALAGRDVRHAGLTYLFARTTGDRPFARGPRTGAVGRADIRTRDDAERQLDRRFAPPARRSWSLDAWVAPAADAADPALDRLAGYRGAARFESSGRYQGLARRRASRAFDGSGDGWIGDWIEGGPAWIGWSVPAPLRVGRLRLVPPRAVVRRPARVRLRADGAASGVLEVGRGGEVVLPRPLTGRRFRLDVLSAKFPAGAPRQARTRSAVGIGAVEMPGLPPARVPRAGPLAGGCGDLTVAVGSVRSGEAAAARHPVALRVQGSVAGLDRATPLRARACGAPIDLPAGPLRLRSASGALRPALLRLRSAPPAPTRAASGIAPGRVLDPGREGRGRRDGVRVDLPAASWLVLGESFNRGWRANCDGRSLGEPVVIDAYANGWRAPAGCRDVSFAFGPNRAVAWGYGLSALACLVLLALLLLRRPRGLVAAAAGAREDEDPSTAPWPLRRALAAGAAAGTGLGFIFAIRAGVLIGPVVALVLWRGVGAHTLALSAGALLLAVAVLYVPLEPQGVRGYNFNYPVDLIAAHWVAVGALVLIGLALARTLSARRGP